MKLQVDWAGNNILINGKRVWMSHLSYNEETSEAHYYFGNGKSDKMLDLQIQDFITATNISRQKETKKIILHINTEDDLKVYEFSVYIDIEEISKVKVQLRPKLITWKNNFTYREFLSNFIRELKKQRLKYFFDNPKENEFLFISKQIPTLNLSLRGEVTEFLKEIEYCIENALFSFANNLTQNNVFTSFQFPSEIKIHCEQYLQYFVRFLQDLGINATSDLKEEAGKVLFSVTPIDDVEALDKIREALAVYLHLPSSPIIFDDSIKSMRMQQQIENLQHSQRMAEMEVRLAQKVIESQDKIIQQKDNTIEQQNRIIERITDKAVMINSPENKEELEKIYEGIEVGESKFIKEQLGIKFNPAKVVKTIVKNTLGKGDEIIELGLDKKD